MNGEAGLPFGMIGEGEDRMPFATAARLSLESAILAVGRSSDVDVWE